MKIKLTIFILALSSTLFSQELKIIHAVQEKDANFFDYEDYEAPDKPIGKLIFLKGCNWYCGGSVKSISASSQLKENNGINYAPKNTHDFDKNTAWVEGKPDYGIGEFIEYRFDFSEMKDYNGGLGINRIILANGYKKSKTTWKNNSRIKRLKVYLNDKPFAMLHLLDSFEIQTIDIGEIKFPVNTETKLKFEIIQVYEGTKYKDTAISLLMFDGIGVH
ncbi:NADase-type glycan-binding domain-containing protein [Aquimarina rubra]|uniref:NAD glycohydrolase translocation F5/8 type C domain-containing protein n=1 Tax=Aquimarina rubra TaxID=1920033 RepID=A0ABW5LGC1_9FLAO